MKVQCMRVIPEKIREGSSSPGNEVTDSCQMLCGFWQPNLGLIEIKWSYPLSLFISPGWFSF